MHINIPIYKKQVFHKDSKKVFGWQRYGFYLGWNLVGVDKDLNGDNIFSSKKYDMTTISDKNNKRYALSHSDSSFGKFLNDNHFSKKHKKTNPIKKVRLPKINKHIDKKISIPLTKENIFDYPEEEVVGMGRNGLFFGFGPVEAVITNVTDEYRYEQKENGEHVVVVD